MVTSKNSSTSYIVAFSACWGMVVATSLAPVGAEEPSVADRVDSAVQVAGVRPDGFSNRGAPAEPELNGSDPIAGDKDPGSATGDQSQATTLLAQPRVEVADGMIKELHVDNWELSTFLEMLSLQSRRNIITSPAVHGDG